MNTTRRMPPIACGTAVIVLHCALESPLSAEQLVTFELRGTIADVQDGADILDSTIQPGDPFVVQITCDLDSEPARRTESSATYRHTSSSACMKMMVAGRAFETDQKEAFEVEVRNQDPQDRFLARGELQVPTDMQDLRWQKRTLLVTMTDDAGRVLPDTRLPATLSLDDWSRASCVLSFVRSARFTGILFYPAASVVVRGRIESIRQKAADAAEGESGGEI